jgi:hypothetical protein
LVPLHPKVLSTYSAVRRCKGDAEDMSKS